MNLYYSGRRYYGQHHSRGWKWLDLEKYFHLIRQDDQIRVIKYFTSLVRGPSQANQKPFLAALRTCRTVKIIHGRFKDTTVERTISLAEGNVVTHLTIKTAEEKRTDVSIAIHLVCDALFDRCDRLVLVSGDTDLVPAVQFVKRLKPAKEVCLLVPSGTPPHLRKEREADELWALVDKPAYLNMDLMRKCQMPAQVVNHEATPVNKPSSW